MSMEEKHIKGKERNLSENWENTEEHLFLYERCDIIKPNERKRVKYHSSTL